jgi:phenylacetate-CoA ligase
MNKAFLKNSLGSKEIAEKLAQKAQQFVPAYQRYLERHGLKPDESFEKLPTSDKKSYILAYPYEDLLGTHQEEIFALFRSSGSSGNSFYWPQLKSAYRASPVGTRNFLEEIFAIQQKKTLAIIGFNLGGWIGGESSSWNLKNVALDAPYPFWVLCPGNDIDEIIKIICQLEASVEQIIILLVPSAITHLHLRISQLQQSLPVKKIRYLVGGEAFPETLRTSFQNQAAVESNIPFMLSVYGSGDTGNLGFESLYSVAVRKLMHQNQALAEELGIEFPIPHFFHFAAPDTFLETVNGDLCVTLWQGIPLVRYLLYDKVSFYGWRELRQAILSSDQINPEDEAWVKLLESASEVLPDLIALTGRSDSCLIIGAANLMEYMLDEAVKNEELNDILTGLYRAKIIYEENQQYLSFDLETIQGITLDQEKIDRVYYSLVKTLGGFEPGFLDSYKNLYSIWDNDPTKRILRLNFLSYPSLSQTTETCIKQRGIVRVIGET